MYNLRNSLKNKYQPLFKGSSGFGSWKQQNDDYWWLHDLHWKEKLDKEFSKLSFFQDVK